MFNRRRLERIEELLTRIDAALVVRDPGTARSVEAYDGLRKQVAVAARSRHQHLAQLVELAVSIDRGATIETLRERVEEWILQAGLSRYDDNDEPDFYEIIGGRGDQLEVLEPAWVDAQGGMLVRPGSARRTTSVADAEAAQAALSTAEDENRDPVVREKGESIDDGNAEQPDPEVTS